MDSGPANKSLLLYTRKCVLRYVPGSRVSVSEIDAVFDATAFIAERWRVLNRGQRIINNIMPKSLSNSSRSDSRLRCAQNAMYARRTFDPVTDECGQRRQ